MKNKKFYNLIFIIFPVLFFTGCFGVNGEFKSIRNEILYDAKTDFETDTEFAVGSFGLAVAGSIVKLSDNKENVEEILENISHVQVGVYKKSINNNLTSDFNFVKKINKKMEKNGWRFIVRSKEDDKVTGIYVNNNYDVEFNRIFVISLNDDELVMVQVEGELEKVIEAALHDKKFAFEMR